MVDKFIVVVKQHAAERTSVFLEPQMDGFKVSLSSPLGLKAFPTLSTANS